MLGKQSMKENSQRAPTRNSLLQKNKTKQRNRCLQAVETWNGTGVFKTQHCQVGIFWFSLCSRPLSDSSHLWCSVNWIWQGKWAACFGGASIKSKQQTVNFKTPYRHESTLNILTPCGAEIGCFMWVRFTVKRQKGQNAHEMPNNPEDEISCCVLYRETTIMWV